MIERAHAACIQRLEREGIAREATAQERAWIHAPAGSLDEVDAMNISWLSEGEAVFGWLLGRMDLPAHDEKVDLPTVDALVPRPGDHLPRVEDVSIVQSEEAVHSLAGAYEGLLWRLRKIPAAGARILPNFVREGVAELGLPLRDGDLLLQGQPAFRYLRSDDVFRRCQSIAIERLRALRWLVADDCAWDELDTDY